MHLSPTLTASIRSRANKDQRTFYLYDTTAMRAKITHLKNVLPESVAIFYAMKANPHPAFLSAAKEAGAVGIEIASLGEAKKAVAAGFTPDRLIFTGPAKSPEELTWSVDHKIRTLHLDSLTEAHRLQKICADKGVTQDVLLRVNPDFDIHESQVKFSGGSSKFGVDAEKLDTILPSLLAMKNLRFRGLHVYAASGVLKLEDLLKNCQIVFDLVKKVEARFPAAICDIIDFGGGFGIDYLEKGLDFSPEAYVVGLEKLIATYGFAERRFVLELGRYLAADSGWFCTEILDIKESHGKKQVVCAGGTNHFRRPAALKINHPVVIVPMNRPPFFATQESVQAEKVYIGGPLCTSADKLADDLYIEKAAIGDIAVFCLAGAYGLSMSHMEFLSHARPEEIILD